MKKLLPVVFSLALLTSCGNSDGSSIMGGYSDGTYRAAVDYYNSSTGTSSTYTLEVEVLDNEITTIYWPNGGWSDDSNFSSTDISDGYASFTSNNGYDYEVRITGEGGSCYTETYIEEDVVESEDDIYTEEEDLYSTDESYSTDEEI